MNWLFSIVLSTALLATTPASAQRTVSGIHHSVVVVRVVDGDTVEIAAPWLPPELGHTILLRIYGVDTPEKGHRAACSKERHLGDRATAFARSFVNGRDIRVRLQGWDKYGGRVIGDLIVDSRSLREELLKNQLARPYHGERKSSWCN